MINPLDNLRQDAAVNQPLYQVPIIEGILSRLFFGIVGFFDGGLTVTHPAGHRLPSPPPLGPRHHLDAVP